MIENTQSGTDDEARSGICLYTPSKNKGTDLRLTACNEDDERQMFYYNFKGLLVVSQARHFPVQTTLSVLFYYGLEPTELN